MFEISTLRGRLLWDPSPVITPPQTAGSSGKASSSIPQRNLVGDKVRSLRLHKRGEVINQLDLAGEIEEAIMELAPENAPVRNSKRKGFTRSDLTKIEQKSRYVRDYELVAIAKVFDVPVSELLSNEASA